MYTVFLIMLTSYLQAFVQHANAQLNLVMEKAYPCHEVPNQKINLTIVLKTFTPSRQRMDISLFTPVPLGNDIRFGINAEMEMKLAAKTFWQRLFYAEDDFCRIIQTYVGELGYELETAMGVRRGTCPIAQGRYHAVNYTLDISHLKLQTFPLGNLRVTIKFLEKPKKNVLLCLEAMLSSLA